MKKKKESKCNSYKKVGKRESTQYINYIQFILLILLIYLLTEQFFNLVLLDTKITREYGIECAKRKIYDKDQKHIAISYRWDELHEQQVKTDDHVSRILLVYLI